MAITPAQFGGKLKQAATNVRTNQRRAIEARALETKRTVVAAARARTRKARPGWVRYQLVDDNTAAVRLWGGMAKLTELGSYHHPDGYTERPRTITARRRALAKRRGATLNESGLMRTPYGPRPWVHHPAIRARPYWRAGLDAARGPGHAAYRRTIDRAVLDAFR